MEKSDLYTILDQIENYSVFEIKRKIYSLSDGAKFEILFDLKIEVYRYLKYKFIELYPEKVNRLNYSTNFLDERLIDRNISLSSFYYKSFEDDSTFKTKLRKAIDRFWLINSISQIESEVERLRDFNIELDELLIEQLCLEKTKAENQIQNETDVVYDLSDSKIVHKLIYLNELGIIDYLMKSKPFDTSINKLATILSAIIGEKPNSIQPALNTMIMDKDCMDKNNPYFNEKNKVLVRQNLINIGCQLEDI